MENKEGLEKHIHELIVHQKKLLDAFEKGRKEKKDIWDKFSVISTFLGALIIATAGSLIAYHYDNLQKKRENSLKEYNNNVLEAQLVRENSLKEYNNNVLEAQLVEKYIPHLISENDTQRAIAFEALEVLGRSDLVLRFRGIVTPEGGKGVNLRVDKIMATARSPEQIVKPVRVITVAATSPAARKGWAYVGNYSFNKWKTRYFEFDEKEDRPNDLDKKTLLKVREATSLNVRRDMPDSAGSFAKVIDVLKPGSAVKVLEVRPWEDSGYMWAEISYIKK